MKEQIEAVQRMQDYIESHWQESITLADLSEGLPFFSLVFCQAVQEADRSFAG